MLETIITAFITSLAVGYVAFYFQTKRLRDELAERYAAERIAQSLLGHKDWGKRTFDEIKKRVGGFDDDELRRILLRAGAVRFEQKGTGVEMWGLLSRNEAAV